VSLTGILLIAALVGHAAVSSGQPQVNAYGAAVKGFRDRADAYLAQHRNLAKQLPPLENTDVAAELTSREDLLGQRIATARAAAKPGDLFGSDLEPYIRAAVKKNWADRPGAREAVGEDLPAAGIAKINQPYPTDQPLGTVPASLLAALPPLPEGLEYRVAGRHLMIRDVKANLVVDVMTNVVPQTAARTGALRDR
jgi:hypothetical protein